MSWFDAIAVLAAGMAAGTINTIVGSGTLITFPTLLALGYPPVLANVSNTVGLVPGSLSGAIGYRRELTGQRSRLLRLGVASLLGGLTGGILLLALPASAFSTIVPALIALGCLMVAAQPWISARVATRHDAPAHGSVWVWLGVFVVGIYGGYFGAAQGVLLVAIMGIGLDETMQRLNAAKNVLAGLVNAVAAALFIVVAEVAWPVALLIAGGAIVGGQIGAGVGRRLPPVVLRVVIVTVGVVAVWQLL
ncbi:MAG TPA: sulfite exporter TauE/SafE family protein [Nocardioidaceae bacterium]|nr:sulfite exporter TauE/SafE family protein [Nocardioidaceae bacterium]